jgi:hypothetical protein
MDFIMVMFGIVDDSTASEMKVCFRYQPPEAPTMRVST